MKNENSAEDSVFFWLGDDSEVEELSEEDFILKIEATRKARENFLNVVI